MKNKKHYLFEIKTITEEHGSLNVIEENKNIPFKIKRIFYEYGANRNIIRGNHANKNSRFCFIALSGSCDVIVEDGIGKTIYHLDKPNKVLYLDNMVWKTMTNFSEDCVLLVLSDCFYDKDEYIKDFNDYLICLSKS